MQKLTRVPLEKINNVCGDLFRILLDEFLPILKRKSILGKTQQLSLSVACFELPFFVLFHCLSL